MENQVQALATDTNNQVPAELNPQQALSVLIQAVNFAQSKGVYSLEDAEILSKAVKVFVKKDETAPEGTVATEANLGANVVPVVIVAFPLCTNASDDIIVRPADGTVKCDHTVAEPSPKVTPTLVCPIAYPSGLVRLTPPAARDGAPAACDTVTDGVDKLTSAAVAGARVAKPVPKEPDTLITASVKFAAFRLIPAACRP